MAKAVLLALFAPCFAVFEDDKCASHPGCAGLAPDDGLCCPVADGTRLACCDEYPQQPTKYYGIYRWTQCSEGHGGIPLDAEDTPLINTTTDLCQEVCNKDSRCVGISILKQSTSWRNPYGDCYLRSAVDLDACVIQEDSKWETYVQTAPPPLEGNIVYHLFERKYTGLANRDAGDFKGDTGFIFGTFSSWSKGNPEASMDHNIIEMTQVNVSGWGRYEECNAPGAVGHFTCPEDQSIYCCTHHDPMNHSRNIPAVHTSHQFPGIEVNFESLGPQYGFGGWWFSFPMESEGVTWTQKLLRRVEGKCVGNAWRKDAGGCDHCNVSLDKCVADCIKANLCANGSTALLQQTWDRVFADPTECPDVPLPETTMVV